MALTVAVPLALADIARHSRPTSFITATSGIFATVLLSSFFAHYVRLQLTGELTLVLFWSEIYHVTAFLVNHPTGANYASSPANLPTLRSSAPSPLTHTVCAVPASPRDRFFRDSLPSVFST